MDQPPQPQDVTQDQPAEEKGIPVKKARARWWVHPPLAPMIGVTFILLAFLMLTFNFRSPEEGGLPCTLPSMCGGCGGGRAPLGCILDPIRVTVRPVGRDSVLFEVQGAQAGARTPHDLYRMLVARRCVWGNGGKDIPVIIRPDRNVPWRWAVEAYNQAVRAGFLNVGWGAA